ncbi:MAG TPA: TetR/AcrR family transcriptional regulator [Streptosporangiaceae bacterium]|nr:TetR/AcrR family transcriptional regulator [Streptosporangiaceae bacterium]
MPASVAASRLDRRKARTRAALVAAARELLTSRDPAGVSIQEITEAADVGFGSFYNHFQSKQELFDAAVEEVIEEHGAMLDEITSGMEDPAEVFAASIRITARFPKTHPQLARIIDRTGPRYLTSPSGLAPRALRDLQRAKDAGRLSFDDPDVAIACAGGALLGVVHLGLTQCKPSAIDRAADGLAVNLLRMFGLPADEAREVAARRLPRTR